jgi:molybdopterin molybdotransferase
VMIEHTEKLDENTIEVYKSVAPGQNVIQTGEDFKKSETVLLAGSRIRPQEAGLLAAFGIRSVLVFQKPRVGILSTGDEIVPIEQTPSMGQLRDINSYTLSGLVLQSGSVPVMLGIVKDDYETLFSRCAEAIEQTDTVFLSGGSSVGTRDLTVDVLSNLPGSRILVHGIPISPGKPTILARVGNKPFWGLPGHVVSAMVVFSVVVRPFLESMAGLSTEKRLSGIPARLARNLASAQGRIDYIRVRMFRKDDTWWADPILGKSGLINTMVKADGLIAIPMNTEGLDQGARVEVLPM